MPHYVGPFGFIFLRVSGAALLFWIISFLGPKEAVEKRDWGRLLLCALLGMVINMLAFFKGLQLSTPINSSVLVTITPIIVVVLSFFLILRRPGCSRVVSGKNYPDQKPGDCNGTFGGPGPDLYE